MGGDGGSIPRRVELVKKKKKPEQANRRVVNAAIWRHCALSQERLLPPIVACRLGRLYNKESIINKLLNRSPFTGTADHVKKLKDVRELRLTVNTAHKETSDPLQDACGEFYCPVTGLEMCGTHTFVFLWSCGCVFAKKALKVVQDNRCMQCGTTFTSSDVIQLNPQTEDEIAAAQKRLEEYVAANGKAKKRPAPSSSESNGAPPKQKVIDPKSKEKTQQENDASQPGTSATAAPSKLAKSIQDDPSASSVYKSLFITSEEAKRQPKAHWVTYNPLYFR